MDLLLSPLVAVSVCQCQTKGRAALEAGIIKIPGKKPKQIAKKPQTNNKTHRKLKYNCLKYFSPIYVLYTIFVITKISVTRLYSCSDQQ